MGRTNDMVRVQSTEYGWLIIWLRTLEAFDTPIGHRQKDEFVMLQPYEQAGEAMLNGERRAF